VLPKACGLPYSAFLWSTTPMLIGSPPPAPQPGEKVALPLIPLVAPVVLSVVMALVLHSPIALMMGVLGPVMVLGSWVHQKKTSAKKGEKALTDYDDALATYRALLATAQRDERSRATRSLPSVQQWMNDPLWRVSASPSSVVRIGEGVWHPPAGHSLSGTGKILAMPAGLDATHGIALIGGASVEDIWRNIVVQWLVASGSGGLNPMPRAADQAFPRDIVGVSRAIWVQDIALVPPECGIVIVPESDTTAVITQPSEAPRSIRPDRLSHAGALWALNKLTPPVVSSRVITHQRPRGHLVATLSPHSPEIDLVLEGPHTAVWGATGSGKSVTVCALVLSLAKSYDPQQLVVVVVDFKGGAGLRPLSNLPHTIGVVTDLEPARSERARVGLVAEMQKRERIMATHQVADVSDLEQDVWCPRLLVVVDEVAWLCANSPSWAETLSDLAQRGRSLGVHVVLSTQRVSGVLPRALMANVSLRICARVSDETEVLEWMPDLTPAHARVLHHLAPGKLLVSGAISAPQWHTVSLPEPAALPETRAQSPWRVWSEDLPVIYAPEPGVWGLMDVPGEQRHHPISDHPLSQGSAVVVGDAGSGRTNTAYALAHQVPNAVVSPEHPAELWQCLRDLQGHGATIVIDKADELLHSAGAEGEAALMDALEGSDARLVMIISPRHRLARGLARLAPARLVLSLGSSDDEAVWGAVSRKIPGRARYGDSDIQVAYPYQAPPLWAPGARDPADRPPLVVTESPENFIGLDTQFIGSAEQLMATWHTLGSTLRGSEVVVDGYSHRDLRHATAGRVVIPPLIPRPGWLWVWRDGVAFLAKPAAPAGL